MGRASKWFRGLLSFKKPDRNADTAPKPPSKKKWTFPKGKHRRRKSHHGLAPADDDETSKQAIAVAAATAAVAEAAVAAAHAAAAVAQLTSGGGFDRSDRPVAYAGPIDSGYCNREERAAVVIQSHFRAYLSRRALRALRALVKLQALVRGHILRKQNVDKLRQLQALVRAQARARAGRAPLSDAPLLNTKTSSFNHAVRIPLDKVDHAMVARSTRHEQPIMSKRNSPRTTSNLVYEPEKSPLIHHWMERTKGETPWEQGSFITRIVHVDDSQSDRVIEVDTGRPNITPLSRSIIHSSQASHASDQYCPTYALSKETASASHQTAWLSDLSPSSGGVQSLSPLTLALDTNGSPFYTANNSPAYYSASSLDGSSKRAPFTPAKSCLSGYSDHPSYMAYTESSKAKTRSVSAPKQRPQWEMTTSQWERSNSVNRYCVQRDGEARVRLNASFCSTREHPGSGRLDKLGMPVRDVSGFSGGLWHRY